MSTLTEKYGMKASVLTVVVMFAAMLMVPVLAPVAVTTMAVVNGAELYSIYREKQ